MSELFPLLPFNSDETPLSWAARQAAFHTGRPMEVFLGDLGISLPDLIQGKPDAILRLCDKAGQDPTPVLHNTVTSLGNRRFKLRHLEFSAEFMTGKLTRVCQKCLAEDRKASHRPNVEMRNRLIWRFEPVRVCPIHKIYLTDINTAHWKKITHELKTLQIDLDVNADHLKDTETVPSSPLQSYVISRLSNDVGPDWCDRQEIDQATRSCEVLGGLIAFGPKMRGSKMSLKLWDDAGKAAWPIVSAGEDAIRSFIQQQLDAPVRKGKPFPSPVHTLGMVYCWLMEERVTKSRGLLLNIVRDEIIKNVPFAPNANLFGAPVTEPRFSSISSIAKAEGIKPTTLKSTLKAAGLLDQPDVKSVIDDRFVEYATVKAFLDIAKNAVVIDHVPKLLNAPISMVQALLDLGILSMLKEHEAIATRFGEVVDIRSVKAVLKFIEDNFEKVVQPPPGVIPLSNFLELVPDSANLVLKLVFECKLEMVFRLRGKHRFASILVSPKEITDALGWQIQNQKI